MWVNIVTCTPIVAEMKITLNTSVVVVVLFSPILYNRVLFQSPVCSSLLFITTFAGISLNAFVLAEVRMGRAPIPASDFWSVGAFLFEAFCGKVSTGMLILLHFIIFLEV